ncbi:alpha/beta hydrolase [Nonomuraea roseoviolacea subsp. roseoviolacea]|uniref:Pimeloyl-ACP methyl ester carboxylesterase n=1 Tax=Nonomuraea roseoviolacea subsp. carminata TaxID=160689 RepID=A0ABT1JWC9_9ACTN|nr:alpha/beta hydrolase [Nonomuraea roseoviolacea]MCP2346068.1 pimeloyl-ACP methyl ester carboxylesterase [Nonomuraea roseoviolacea subsp. carminata]
MTITTLPLGDGDLHVRQDGPRDAPALLLIHGTASSSVSWNGLVPLLTESHRVIRVDLPGHGRSAEPAGGDYRVPHQARRVGEALDRLGVGHAVAVGHSSGGLTATALAEQRPDLVTALALVNTGPGMDAFIAQETAAIDPSRWPPSDEQLRMLASTGFGRADYEIPQEFMDVLRHLSLGTFAATTRAAQDYLEQRRLPDRLKVLGKPLLVIFGEDDRRWRSSSAAGYLAVPGATVEMLPGVGHTPIVEDPPRTAALLLAFTALHS